MELIRSREGSRESEIPTRHYLGQRAGGSPGAGRGGEAYAHQINLPNRKSVQGLSCGVV